MRSTWINLGLVVCSTALSLLLLEPVSRLVYPVSAGPQFITTDGSKLKFWTEPGRTYRQVSIEYDAVTNITTKGYRIPEVRGNPEVIFIGDSYTFGVGLSDNETFPFQYGLSRGVSIANLATPGWGTGEEIDRLEQAILDWNWRPRSVKLFMFAMTTSIAGGNDIVDNLAYNKEHDVERMQQVEAKQRSTLWSRIYNYCRGEILLYSNLARILKFHLGSQMRSVVTLSIDMQKLKQSLEVTRRQLLRIQALSQEYGFTYEIFLIHPVQDIIMGTADQTHQALQIISPVTIWETVQLFAENPASYYYAYDGHLNKRGSSAIAQFLLSREINN
jgi:hypothetical protein